MNKKNRKLSWRPDKPDFRDHLYCNKWKDDFNSPSSYDLTKTQFMPKVLDQGELGSCVDNAVSSILSFIEAKEGNGLELFSVLFLYYNARDDKNNDTGSEIRDCIKGLSNYGVCIDNLWPYVESKFKEKPNEQSWAEAKHRSADLQYARLITLDDMIHCISSGYPFAFGISLYGKEEDDIDLDNLTSENPILNLPTKNETLIGGHALMAVGYDTERKIIKVRNSWGNDWCQNGYFDLPFDYITNDDLTDDIWTFRRIAK
jgi:C1A family cysteine protease